MTTTVDGVDGYVRAVRHNVWGELTDVERLEADLRSRFDVGRENGESVSEVAERLGSPEDVAAAFMEDRKLVYASFFERLVAFVGDGGVCASLGIPFALVAVVVGPRLDGLEGGVSFGLGLAGLLALMFGYIGILVCYFPVLEHRFGQTAGKRLMGIHVRTEAGAAISLGAAVLRRLSLYFEVFVLDALFAPFTKKRQRALDIVAKTVVVRGAHARGALRYLACVSLWLPAVLVVAVLLLLLPN